jgi:hypothetical protein
MDGEQADIQKIQKHKKRLSMEQRKELIRTTREIGLLSLAGVVAQKVVSGAALVDPIVIGGFAVSLFMYALMLRFLLVE